MITSNRHSFLHDFRQMRADHAALCELRDPGDLLDALHGPGGDPEARNRVLLALVAAAQGTAANDTAMVLILLALWPGLDAVHGRLRRTLRPCSLDLTEEIPVRLIDGVARLDPNRVRRVAATLLRNLERDIRRAVAVERAQACTGLCEAWADTQPRAEILPETRHLPEAEAQAQVIAWLTTRIGGDAELVHAVAIDGQSQCAAAARMGLGPEAGRKRYRRALARLKREIFS